MSKEQLRTAASHLDRASDAASGDASDRLTDLAGQLETLADRDRGPDHGRLARVQNALSELRGDAGEEITGAIDDAKAAIREYRETVEGV